MASRQQGKSAKAAPELELSRAKRNFRLRALSRAVAEPSRTVATLVCWKTADANGCDVLHNLVVGGGADDRALGFVRSASREVLYAGKVVFIAAVNVGRRDPRPLSDQTGRLCVRDKRGPSR